MQAPFAFPSMDGESHLQERIVKCGFDVGGDTGANHVVAQAGDHLLQFVERRIGMRELVKQLEHGLSQSARVAGDLAIKGDA